MTPGEHLLPYGGQVIDEDDLAAVAQVLKSGYLTTGPATEGFEKKLTEVTGAGYGVSCSSGTAALHIAAIALGLGPGDKVVVPTITFLATANAVRFVGADVVFADVDPDTGLMRPEDAREAVLRGGEGVKAIFPVHLAGQTVDMNGIAKVAEEFGLSVVDDACHAIGGFLDGFPVGGCQYSDMTVFSFHPVKTVAMGEGGAVTTNNPNLARSLRQALSHGVVREVEDFVGGDLTIAEDGMANPWAYEMQTLGFNYRASDIHCALGLSQMRKLDSFVAIRRRLMKCYEELLAPLAPMVRPTGRTKGCEPAWHLNIVLIDFVAAGICRKDLMIRLRARGIGTQVHYIPVHRQPYYRDRYGETDLPGSTQYYERCLSLPLSAGMSESDVERVIAALKAELRL